MRDCTCDQQSCRLCWLYHNDPTYRRYWDAAPAQQQQQLGERQAPLSSFLAAMAVEIAWRATGGRGPMAEEKAERRRLCDSCQNHDPKADSCMTCGCYLEARLIPPIPFGKLDCATQRCPIGLWGYVGGYEGPKCGGCGQKK